VAYGDHNTDNGAESTKLNAGEHEAGPNCKRTLEGHALTLHLSPPRQPHPRKPPHQDRVLNK